MVEVTVPQLQIPPTLHDGGLRGLGLAVAVGAFADFDESSDAGMVQVLDTL